MRTPIRLSIAILLAALTLPAAAQSLTGSISGTLKDEQGGVLPGAAVTLTGKTGARTATSDADGSYRFPALSPGSYAIQVELAGFKPMRQENVPISVGRNVEIGFTLAVGGLTEIVEVVGEAPVVDMTSTATNTTLSQELLFEMPLDRRSFNVYNYAPGINDSSAFGGTQDYGNALMLDGVDTRDPEGGSDWTFFNYNIIEEVQIQGLGAPAEYGAYTGAVVNTISKSGGNHNAGLFDLYFTNEDLGGENASDEVFAANPALGDPPRTTRYIDFTGQISGPIQQDRLFYFLSSQYFNKRENPSGPRTIRKELSHRMNGKLNWNPRTDDQFQLAIQFDDYNIWGRPGYPGTLLSNDAQTVEEDAPEWVWNLSWRHLFGSKTFLDTKYVGWWGYYYLDPVAAGADDPYPGVNNHYDGATSAYTGGGGYYYYADRGRHQANASVSHFAEAFGQHDLKFGVEIERSKTRSRYGYGAYGDGGCCYYYDYGGPYYAYQYSYDVEGRNQRESVFAQDSWKPLDRLTINAGVRLDMVRGRSPIVDQTLYDAKTIAPRIGFAWDVTGDRTTVVKAHFGQYYEGIFFYWYNKGVPGVEDFLTLDPLTFEELDASPTPLYRIDDEIRHPRVDEITVGFEREVGRHVRVSVTGIYRKYKNFVSSVFPSARWTADTVTSDLISQPLGIYQWANEDESAEDGLVTNPDGFVYLDENGAPLGTAEAYRDYKGLMLVVSKRFSNRWQAQVSYVLSETKGTVDPSGLATTGQGRQFETPTLALVNADGTVIISPTHEVKSYLTYQIPTAEVGVNLSYRMVSGDTYTAWQRYSSSAINFPYRAGREPWLEPRGSRRLKTTHVLDLRLEKILRVGGGEDRLGLYMDVTNVFNSGTTTAAVSRYPGQTIGNDFVDFDGPRSIQTARQITFGARWQF